MRRRDAERRVVVGAEVKGDDAAAAVGDERRRATRPSREKRIQAFRSSARTSVPGRQSVDARTIARVPASHLFAAGDSGSVDEIGGAAGLPDGR